MRTIRFERRLHIEPRQAALARVAGAVAGLLVAGFVLLITGRNPFSLLWKSIDGTFLQSQGREETVPGEPPFAASAATGNSSFNAVGAIGFGVILGGVLLRAG